MTESEPIRVLPANEAAWQDLQDIFGDRGPGHRCQCQRYRLRPGESFGRQSIEERAARLREQTNAGMPEAGTSGLVVASARSCTSAPAVSSLAPG